MAQVINISRSAKKAAKAEKSKSASKRKKIDWQKVRLTVHNGCRVVIYRTLEAVVLFLFISLTAVAIGSTAIPLLAYDMSEGFGLTQNTNVYIAVASWILPMLFYTLLITAATFCVYKRFIKWVHGKFTALIKKPEMTEKESK